MALHAIYCHPADLRGQVRSGAWQKSPVKRRAGSDCDLPCTVVCVNADLIPSSLEDNHYLGDRLNKTEIPRVRNSRVPHWRRVTQLCLDKRSLPSLRPAGEVAIELGKKSGVGKPQFEACRTESFKSIP
jgi:hypothetical protein